jgi:hypothetical protein
MEAVLIAFSRDAAVRGAGGRPSGRHLGMLVAGTLKADAAAFVGVVWVCALAGWRSWRQVREKGESPGRFWLALSRRWW